MLWVLLVVTSKTPHESKLVGWLDQKDAKDPSLRVEATDTHLNTDIMGNPEFGFTRLADGSNSLSKFG